MKNRMISMLGMLVLSALLLSACSGIPMIVGPAAKAPTISNRVNFGDTGQLNPSAALQSLSLADYEKALEDIYARVSPSVVNIRVVQQVDTAALNNPFSGLPFFGLPNGGEIPQAPQFNQALGSGFVWDQQGHIVTNNHVIEGADKIEVTFADGTTVPAKVIGSDLDSDLAVIQVDLPAGQLHPVQFADSTQVKVGQVAIAIGNPFGLEGTMTTGIISALGRILPVNENNPAEPAYSIPDVLQTDAPINPGNSGGVLVDDQGQVIGVTAAIRSTSGASAGIGFAIPSALVQKVVPALIKTGRYEHPYLGISGTTLTPDLAKAMNLEADQRGALVEDVSTGGPADKAGLRGSDREVEIDGQSTRVGGDVLVAIDDSPIKSMDDLIAYLMDHTAVGQQINLSLLRDGQEKSLSVTLEPRPHASDQANLEQSTQASAAWLGIQGISLTVEISRAMNLDENQQGVLIQQVAVGSPADQAGLRGSDRLVQISGRRVLVGGDVITSVDGREVATSEHLQAFLLQARPGQEINLGILREGRNAEVPVTLANNPAGNP